MSASGGQGVPATPPTPLPSHAVPPPTPGAVNPLLSSVREQERVYMELLSRPPYNTDPLLAQQVSLSVRLACCDVFYIWISMKCWHYRVQCHTTSVTVTKCHTMLTPHNYITPVQWWR